MRHGAHRRDTPLWLSAALVLGTVAVYVGLFGAGTERRQFVELGLGGLALAVALVAFVLIRGPERTWIEGSAHVVSASDPPPGAAYGRCELQVVVDAPGLPATAVRVRDPRVPLAKWPDAGATLPILVAVDDPRRLRVQWDEVPTHAESAAEEELLAEEGLLAYPRFGEAALPEPDEESYAYADSGSYVPGGRTYVRPELTDEELAVFSGAAGARPPRRRVLPLEDEPSSLVARYLFPTERYRGEWKRHWVRPIRGYVTVLAYAVLGIVAVRQRVADERVTQWLAGICAAGAALSLYAALAWYFGRFVLTNKRAILVEGILRRRVSSVSLIRVTDLRYQQSFWGRVLNYGDFVIEGARWFSRMRRVADLPNPNELYLRTVEELYEPGAVEARLSSYRDAEDRDAEDRTPANRADHEGAGAPGGMPPSPVPTETLSQALREAIYGPTLANYDGWVSVEVLADGEPVPISEDRRLRLEPDRSYEIRVAIGAQPTTDTAEPLVVTGGVDREVIEFSAEVDSDERGLRRPAQTLAVGEYGGTAEFTFRTPREGFATSPWLWVRVSQQRRLLQSVELTATGPAVLDR